jgi:hypothetical protein
LQPQTKVAAAAIKPETRPYGRNHEEATAAQQYRTDIDDAWVEQQSGQGFGTTNPYPGKVWARVADKV